MSFKLVTRRQGGDFLQDDDLIVVRDEASRPYWVPGSVWTVLSKPTGSVAVDPIGRIHDLDMPENATEPDAWELLLWINEQEW